MDLTARHSLRFRNDIRIIFEASYVCYDDTVLPKGVITEPLLLTNNLKLYKRFIADPINEKILEEVINLYGFEHLIRVVRPKDVIIGWS